MKVYTKDHVKQLMLDHWPVCQDRQYNYWYCKCGKFIDFPYNYGEHLDSLFRKTKGD